MSLPNLNENDFFSTFFQIDPFQALSGPTESLPEDLKLKKELDTGWPPVFDFLQPYWEDLLNRISNVVSRVWDFFQDKLAEAYEWIWNNIAFPLAVYVWDVYNIVEQWTYGWREPWKTIAKLFLFPSAFLYKAWRDYIGPALSNAVNEVKMYFDGAFQAAADIIASVFRPIIDPIRDFFDKAKKFFTEDIPTFFRNAYEFFTSLPGRIMDLYNWLKDTFGKSIQTLIDFFTKTLPDWFDNIRSFFTKLPDRIRRFFFEELPQRISQIVEPIVTWINNNIVTPAKNAVQNAVETFRTMVERFVEEVWNAVQNLPRFVSGHGIVGTFLMILPLAAAEFAIAIAVDLLSIKIMGSGIDPELARHVVAKHLDAMFDVSMFTSVMMAVAIQKPLELEVKRMFRTERPSPGDALKFLAKNLIDVDEARYYLAISGYPDEISDKYIRSIFREPPFSAVFTAFKRGKISEAEYRAWLSILNVDKAETLSGTLYPYRVLEEAEYRLPSPFLLAYAIETGELSDDMIRKILEYDLIHPEFTDVMVNALKWRALRDERSLLRRYVIDLFSEGSLKLDEFEHYLGVLGVAPDLMRSIADVADLNRHKAIRRKALSYLEKQFLEGYMDRNEFVDKLASYGFDEELAREYAALLQYVRDNYIMVKETKDERSSLKTSLVSKYKRGLLTDEELELELRKLNLNEIEIALTVARAKLEFDAEQKEILFNDLIERLKQGRLSKTEFTDQCTRLGIRYERCLAYADYYWTKYIGDEFYAITKDERSSLATSLIKKYLLGFMTEEELRSELKKLMYTDEEIELRIKRAATEDEVKMLSDLIAEADSLLKKGYMNEEEYVGYLASLGMRRERAEARAKKIVASALKKAG